MTSYNEGVLLLLILTSIWCVDLLEAPTRVAISLMFLALTVVWVLRGPLK